MSKRIHLIIIDPQRSFCAPVDAAKQQIEHDGELCVPGAWGDMIRVGDMIRRLGRKLDAISVTLDSHQINHIAHPLWWKDSSGKHPNPFTLMREENGKVIGYVYDSTGKTQDVGEFFLAIPRPDVLDWSIKYLKSLAAGGRYPHCIWPVHCLIGTKGHNVVEPLMQALLDWSVSTSRIINFVTKGSNAFVEHFSAVRAEVEFPGDPSTQINSAFISILNDYDEVVGGGEALSHCFANTFSDIASTFKDDSFIKKFKLLKDGSSNVPGFEFLGDKFVKEMTARGMQETTTTEYLK